MNKETELQKLKQIQQPKLSESDAMGKRLLNEMDNLKKLNNGVKANSVVVKSIDDHKNVFLYSLYDGKKIGGLHPNNAEYTMKLYYSRGIPVQLKPPTAEEMAEFAKTDAYKQLKKKENERKELRKKTRKRGQLEEMAKMIARETGKAVKNEVVGTKQ